MTNYDKFITFLKGLEAGFEIEIEERTYGMGYDSVGKPRIAHKVESLNTATGEKSYSYMQGLDLPEINNFIIYILRNLSDEQVTEINANIALNKIKNEKANT